MSIGNVSLFAVYETIPWVTAAIAELFFVLRCRLGVKGKLLWTVFVVLACSRMWIYRQIGGEAIHPLCVPELLVRTLDISFFGTMALAALAVPLFFWRSRVKAFVLPVVAYALSLVGVMNAVAVPIVRRYVVVSDRVSADLDGYRIVQISDIHASCGCRRWHTESIVTVANGLAADLVCLTGDFVDGSPC